MESCQVVSLSLLQASPPSVAVNQMYPRVVSGCHLPGSYGKSYWWTKLLTAAMAISYMSSVLILVWFPWISCILFGLGFCSVFICFPSVSPLPENFWILAKMLLQFLCSVPSLLQRNGCCAADRRCCRGCCGWDQWRYSWWKSHRCLWDLMIEANRNGSFEFPSQEFPSPQVGEL